jgi:hypothetical protein
MASGRVQSRRIGDPMSATAEREVGVLEVVAPRPFAEPDHAEDDVYTFPAPTTEPPAWVLRVVERRRGAARS